MLFKKILQKEILVVCEQVRRLGQHLVGIEAFSFFCKMV